MVDHIMKSVILHQYNWDKNLINNIIIIVVFSALIDTNLLVVYK